MSLDWIWLMPNKQSAKRAIKVGVFVCGVLAFAYVMIAPLFSQLEKVALELAVFYAIVTWRLRNNSRIFAVLGLLVTVYFYRDRFTSLPRAIFPSLVALVLLNTVRATFLFHGYEKAEKENQVAIPA